MHEKLSEINFDGLVGPTHHYGGLSSGNTASTKHHAQIAHPKEAALQGLAKMKELSALGINQAILPPLFSPKLEVLRELGFSGTPAQIIEKAYKVSPRLLSSIYSAASMWVANAAVMTPSRDTQDLKAHFSIANLSTHFHRSIEARERYLIFKAFFSESSLFTVHPSLPSGGQVFCDEGSANHTRFFCRDENEEEKREGVHLFVYGHHVFSKNKTMPIKFASRQSFEASSAIARRHQIKHVFFARQHPKTIDAGVFHNDVICVGHENFLFLHEHAFEDQERVLTQLKEMFLRLNGVPLGVFVIKEKNLSLNEVVETYLFNSQLLTLPTNQMLLLAPLECQQNKKVSHFLEQLVLSGKTPISQVKYVDLTQSMQNGGGPACLRLRVFLSPSQITKCHPNIFFSDILYESLVTWVKKHYRDSLSLEDLLDPSLTC